MFGKARARNHGRPIEPVTVTVDDKPLAFVWLETPNRTVEVRVLQDHPSGVSSVMIEHPRNTVERDTLYMVRTSTLAVKS